MSPPSADLLDRLVEERERQSPAVPLRLPGRSPRTQTPADTALPPGRRGQAVGATLAETDDRQMRHVPLSPQDEPQNGCRASPLRAEGESADEALDRRTRWSNLQSRRPPQALGCFDAFG
jgi:hypothetical protein